LIAGDRRGADSQFAEQVRFRICRQTKWRLEFDVRIVVNMIARLLADKIEFENGRPKPTYKHKLLAMIDEFPALGKLEILQQSLAFVAGSTHQYAGGNGSGV
jgi:type IV secretory pathway TraG/TraD family ATPase VirD4